MPTYDYQCYVCKKQVEKVRRLSEREDPFGCPDCGTTMTQVILSAPSFVPPVWNVSYKCVATGKEITSESQRKRVMKEAGLADAREFDPPDWDKMEQQAVDVQETAAKEVEIPAELKDAMVRENLTDLL